MDRLFGESSKQKIGFGDLVVGLYIIAIFVFENKEYSTLFSIIQLIYFGYLAYLVFTTKKLPFNGATKWIIAVFCFTFVYWVIVANAYVNTTSFIVFKNILKALGVIFYLYVKKNSDFIINIIAVAGIICGAFITASFITNPLQTLDLKYASNSRIGAEIAGGNVNVVAMNMCFAFAACVYCAFNSEKKGRRVFWYICMAFIAFSSFLTGSRKVILSFLVIFIVANNGIKLRYKVLGLLSLAAVYWLLMNNESLYFLLGHKIDFFSNDAYKLYDSSDSVRSNLIAGAWEMFCQKPWGKGFGCVQEKFGLYAHNNYLEVLASLGLVGFITYYSLYVWGLIKSYKNRLDGKCFYCTYTLVGVLLLEMTQITCYYPMIYIFLPLMVYVLLDNHRSEGLIQ